MLNIPSTRTLLAHLATPIEQHGEEAVPAIDLKLVFLNVPVTVFDGALGDVECLWDEDGNTRVSGFGAVPLTTIEYDDNSHVLTVSWGRSKVIEKVAKVRGAEARFLGDRRCELHLKVRIVQPGKGTVERLHEAVKSLKDCSLLRNEETQTDLVQQAADNGKAKAEPALPDDASADDLTA